VFYQKVLAVLPVIVGDVPITAVHVGQLHSEHVVAIGLVSATHALVVERGPGVVLCSAPSVPQSVFNFTEKALVGIVKTDCGTNGALHSTNQEWSTRPKLGVFTAIAASSS